MDPNPFNLLIKLLKSVDSIGLTRTEQLLDNALKEEIIFSSPCVQHVVTTVANEFGIDISEIIYGSGRKNERRYAVGFCSYYLNTIFEMNMEDIAKSLKKVPTLVYKYKKEITNLTTSHLSDMRYYQMKKKFDTIFIR